MRKYLIASTAAVIATGIVMYGHGAEAKTRCVCQKRVHAQRYDEGDPGFNYNRHVYHHYYNENNEDGDRHVYHHYGVSRDRDTNVNVNRNRDENTNENINVNRNRNENVNRNEDTSTKRGEGSAHHNEGSSGHRMKLNEGSPNHDMKMEGKGDGQKSLDDMKSGAGSKKGSSPKSEQID